MAHITLSQKPGKEGRIGYLISMNSDFSSIKLYMLGQEMFQFYCSLKNEPFNLDG